MSSLDALNAWMESWAFWIPYLLGFSMGGLFGATFVVKVALSIERMERRRVIKTLRNNRRLLC